MALLINVFCDFDGTITKKDLGDEIFKVFGCFEPLHSQLISGEINIYQYWQQAFSTLKPGLTREEVRRFALEQETDAYFVQFANFCRLNNIPLSVVSDGYDAYIEPVLESLGLESIQLFCNKMTFDEHGSPKPLFTGAVESCHCMSASCKRNALLKESPDEAIIVYIGDGLSDCCPAEHSDIVFAKKNLAAYCNKNRVPHYPFGTFFDIYKILNGIVDKGKAKHRLQAVLHRKNAFEAE